jgi:hypothetical protein
LDGLVPRRPGLTLLPLYYLLRDRDRTVLALSEWEDLTPPDRLVVKPILRSPAHDGEPLVSVCSFAMGDLRRPCRRSRRRETELSGAVANGCDPLTRHLPLKDWTVDRTFHLPPAASAEMPQLTHTRMALAVGDSSWSDIIPKTVAASYLFGSAVYAPDARRDLDLAVICGPTQAHELRDAIAQARRRLGHSGRRGFAFRIRIGPTVVDFFPGLATGRPHPLARPVAWTVVDEPRHRTVEVVGTEFDSYAWPTLMVKPAPRLLLVCSNAFRGSFLVGDHLEVRATRVEVQRVTSSLTIDVVGDPWRDIRRSSELFMHDRAPLR